MAFVVHGFQKYFRRFVPDYASLSRLGRGSVSDDRFIEDPGYPPQISAPTPALREPEYTPGEPLAGLPCVAHELPASVQL